MSTAATAFASIAGAVTPGTFHAAPQLRLLQRLLVLLGRLGQWPHVQREVTGAVVVDDVIMVVMKWAMVIAVGVAIAVVCLRSGRGEADGRRRWLLVDICTSVN